LHVPLPSCNFFFYKINILKLNVEFFKLFSNIKIESGDIGKEKFREGWNQIPAEN
jgi:hypothetical protein